jgi:hypothetical protein
MRYCSFIVRGQHRDLTIRYTPKADTSEKYDRYYGKCELLGFLRRVVEVSFLLEYGALSLGNLCPTPRVFSDLIFEGRTLKIRSRNVGYQSDSDATSYLKREITEQTLGTLVIHQPVASSFGKEGQGSGKLNSL